MPRVLSLPCRFLFLALAAGVGASEPTERDLWQQASFHRFNEAHRGFTELIRQAPSDRNLRLGAASMLLNVQPRTDGNIAAARAELTALAAEKGDDDPGILARFLIARIDEFHLGEPNLPSALQLYHRLFLDHPEHPIGQRAGVKWCLLAVFSTKGPQREAVLAQAEAFAPRFTDPAMKSVYHLSMADIYVRLKRPPALSLPHLQAVLAGAGPIRSGDTEALLMRAGLTARAAGHPALARELLAENLRRFPNGTRAHMVRLALAELERAP